MANFKATIDDLKLDRKGIISEADFRVFALRALSDVNAKNTQLSYRGKQVDGRGFKKKYSKKYAKLRKKAGLSSRVTLAISGALHNSKQVKARGKKVEAIYVGQHGGKTINSKGETQLSRGNISNAALAQHHESRFGIIHGISDKMQRLIEQQFSKLLDTKLKTLVTIKKGR